MDKPGTKEAAESVLRELPSVVGAFVREDAYGNPREIHLLIKAGPKPASFARDVKDLLEERLGVPIDQRIVSIAQLAGDAVGMGGVQAAAERAGVEAAPSAAPSAALAPSASARVEPSVRLLFVGATHEIIEGRVVVQVQLEWEGRQYVGEAVELEAGSGRVRAGATAALRAATAACVGRARFELEAASLVRALGREYALVSALVSAPALGRQPLLLSGAKPLDEVDPVETASALAALKAANRVLGMIVRLGDAQRAPRTRRGREPGGR